jgi:hypothetical protein
MGVNRKPASLLFIAALSVKNSDTAEEKGYDGRKKVSGIFRLLQLIPKAFLMQFTYN